MVMVLVFVGSFVACVRAGSSPDAESAAPVTGPTGPSDPRDPPARCASWANWTCDTSSNYCYAQCDGTYWIESYPGTSYPSYWGGDGGSGSCDSPDAASGLECDACAAVFADCVVL